MRGTGKKKIEIEKIEDNRKRYVTFSKRRNGLFKKVEEFETETACNLAALVFSPTAKKLKTAGNLRVINQFIYDTSDSQVAGIMRESEVEVALRVQAGKNVEELDDLNELMEIRSELGRIKESLLQHLNSDSMSICNNSNKTGFKI